MATLDTNLKKEFVDSINRVNGTTITPSDIDFGDIRKTSSGLFNAAIETKAKGGADALVTGEKTFLYKRVDISTLEGLLCTTLAARPVVRTADLLDEINRNCKLNLTLSDIYNETISLTGEEGDTFVLRCSDTSPKYIGQLRFTMHLRSSVVLRGKMQVTSGTRYRIFTNGSTMFRNAPYTLLLINGVEHTIAEDGYLTPTVETGEWDFYYCCPSLGTFGQNAPISELDLFMTLDNSLVSGSGFFSGNKTLTRIGDDIFRGSAGVITLDKFCYQCTNLVSVGENFFASPMGYSSYASAFFGCGALATFGETDVLANPNPIGTADSMFQGCGKLSRIPADLFKNAPDLSIVTSAFNSVGSTADNGTYIPDELFDGAPNLTTAGSVFLNVKSRHWPARIFNNHSKLTNLNMAFNSSDIPTLADGALAQIAPSYSVTAAFQYTNLARLGAGLLPAGSVGFVDSMFSNAKIGTVDANVFTGTKFNSAGSLFNSATITDELPNIFVGQTNLTNIVGMFRSAKINLTEANKTLFADMVNVTDITSLFYGTTFDNGVLPKGIFDALVKVTALTATFREAKGGQTILTVPSGLFAKQNLAKDFSLIFVGSGNIQFEGSILPTANSATSLYNAFGGSAANTLPVDLLANAGNVTDMRRTFETTAVSEFPAGFFDACVNVTTIDSMLSGARYLNTLPADIFAAFGNVVNATSLFNSIKQPFIVPEGLFDPLVNVTDMHYLFRYAPSVVLPKKAFYENVKLTSFYNPFERVALGGDVEDMFNPALAALTPNISGLFQQLALGNTNFGKVAANIPLTGNITMAMANIPTSLTMTVPELLLTLGVSSTNHILDVNDVTLPRLFLLNGVWLSGSRDALIKGLWGVADASMVPTSTTDIVLSGVNIVT